MTHVLLVAGGQPDTWPDLDFTRFDAIIGIDRGNWFLLEAGIRPAIAIGDFDSLSDVERARVFEAIPDHHQSPAEKDDTDTQLALATAFDRFPGAEVTIIGASGGRLDHLMANLYLGLEPRFVGREIVLRDQQNTMVYRGPGQHQISKEVGMTYLAFVGLTAVQELSIQGAKYDLPPTDYAYPVALVSNEFLTDTVTLTISSGVVAVIQSKDA
jgi:thiamine pyrophosphokinase